MDYCLALGGRDWAHAMRLQSGSCGPDARRFERRDPPTEAELLEALNAPKPTAYQQYLTSPQWRRVRRLVLDRCRGVCEGCGSAPVAEVHHLTYEHVQAEFLFELVALCGRCHDRVHSEAEAAAAE